VRHLRIIGLCLIATFASSAVFAGSALAKRDVWQKFNDCPLTKVESNGCIYGEAQKESFFQAGKVTVYFVHPVKLNLGFTEKEESFEMNVFGAQDGHTIVKVNQPAPSLTEGIDTSKLSETEKTRYEAYLAAGGSTKVTATVELALPASDIYLNEANRSEEHTSELQSHVQ
jgi:hypothetical protein